MAPVARLTALALVLSAAFATASPVLAPIDPSGPTPAFARDENYALAAAPSVPKVKVAAKVKVGVEYELCTVPGTIAITFDDGPGVNTGELLNEIKKIPGKPKVTFFVNGNNGGKVEDDPKRISYLKQADKDGHQIASHTWSHADLTKLSDSAIKKEMNNLEALTKRLIGKVPAYMRPPFGARDDRVKKTLGSLNYKIIYWSHDTNDWQHPKDVKKGLKVYTDPKKGALISANLKAGKGPIVLQHDTEGLTPTQLGPQAIRAAIKAGFKVVTVAECLGDKGGEYK